MLFENVLGSFDCAFFVILQRKWVYKYFYFEKFIFFVWIMSSFEWLNHDFQKISFLPARVWLSLAIQSQAMAWMFSLFESWSKSTNSLIPDADDIACSSSGIIRARTTSWKYLRYIIVPFLKDIPPVDYIQIMKLNHAALHLWNSSVDSRNGMKQLNRTPPCSAISFWLDKLL